MVSRSDRSSRRSVSSNPRHGGERKGVTYHGCLAVISRSSFMLSGSRGYTLVSRMYCGSIIRPPVRLIQATQEI